VRFELVEVRKEYIPGNRPGKPDAVIQFEDQKDIDGLPDCETSTKELTVVYYVEHGYYPFTGQQGGPVRTLMGRLGMDCPP
jgi:hypothetical protein